MSLPNELLPVGLLGTGAADTGYLIERSLRFNSADSSYLSRTPSTAGNRKTWTWSGWVKRSGLASFQYLLGGGTTANDTDYLAVYFRTGDTLRVASGSTVFRETSQVFRDTSSWYHFVLVVDTTQATASNRVRLYVNGAEITAFGSANNPTQNADTGINATSFHTIGRNSLTPEYYFNGYLADCFLIDGQALDPTSFGEFDDNGIWQPKAYTGSYGTNGFHLDFADNSTAAALGTDTSGNGNDWTVNNLSVTETSYLYGDFDGTNNDNIQKSGAGVLTSSGDVTIECHIYPRSTSVVGIFDGGPNQSGIIRNYTGGKIAKQDQEGSGASFSVTVNQWQHFACTFSSGTIKVFIDGVLNATGSYTSGYVGGNNFAIGTINNGSDGKFNGFIRNFRVTKSLVYASNFTPPQYFDNLSAIANTSLLTLVTNDDDGSSNNYTLNNAGVTLINAVPDTDSLVDVPTNGTETDTGVGGEVRGNYATGNPLFSVFPSLRTLSNGNLDWKYTSATTTTVIPATIFVSSGKWYAEFTVLAIPSAIRVGILKSDSLDDYIGKSTGSYGYQSSDGNKRTNAASTSYGATYTTNDVIGIALDLDSGTLTFYKNGVSQGQAYTGITGSWTFAADSNNNSEVAFNAGQRPFAYTAPSGFKALCTANLPAPVVTKPSEYMDVLTWLGTGTSSSRTFTGLDFGPDLVWAKDRSTTSYHTLYDKVRDTGKLLSSNVTDSEVTNSQWGYISSFNSDGFTTTAGSTDNSFWNVTNDAYVAWCWDAGSSTVTNTQGSITSSVRANPSAGFSIVSWVANNTAGATVGHGLGVAPSMIIVKNRDRAYNWSVYHSSLTSASYVLTLNSTSAQVLSTEQFNGVAPSSSVITLGANGNSNSLSGDDIIAYCFAPVAGYSSFGSFSANGSSDGNFIYLGFRPRWIMTKRTDTVGNWFILDTARNTYNVMNNILDANLSSAERNDNIWDATANGMKFRIALTGTYIYAAFAEHPFQYARAR